MMQHQQEHNNSTLKIISLCLGLFTFLIMGYFLDPARVKPTKKDKHPTKLTSSKIISDSSNAEKKGMWSVLSNPDKPKKRLVAFLSGAILMGGALLLPVPALKMRLFSLLWPKNYAGSLKYLTPGMNYKDFASINYLTP